jgi:tRNA1(Val) A37 N6-methylase TrmN6
MDSYYTSSKLANKLVRHVRKRNIGTVADFCIGDGALIKAANEKWPDAKCFGVDISSTAISSLKQKQSKWKLSVCDLLKKRSRSTCQVLYNQKKGFDLILLNPPFTCIGSTLYEVKLDEKEFKCSTALAFLTESLNYLSNTGSLYAILPISCAFSKKDALLWQTLEANYQLKVIEILKDHHFKNCSPTIILVSLNDPSVKGIDLSFKRSNNWKKKITLMRGNLRMHSVRHNKKGNLLIHTTNLQRNRIVNLNVKVKTISSCITGPALLLPRVGKPDLKKVVSINKSEVYAISDCIIAIKTETLSDSLNLKKLLKVHWNEVRELYKGTGAPYLTIERIEKYLGMKETIAVTDNNNTVKLIA